MADEGQVKVKAKHGGRAPQKNVHVIYQTSAETGGEQNAQRYCPGLLTLNRPEGSGKLWPGRQRSRLCALREQAGCGQAFPVRATAPRSSVSKGPLSQYELQNWPPDSILHQNCQLKSCNDESLAQPFFQSSLKHSSDT